MEAVSLASASIGVLAVVAVLVGVALEHSCPHGRPAVPSAPPAHPARWPLNPRVIVNSEERRVWRWLCRAFVDHHIMVKIPVTRFTMPRSPDNSVHWFNLLNGAYCTFTVCTPEGRAVGCVDVPGPKGPLAPQPAAQAQPAHPVRHRLLADPLQ
jgi:hypothetical protein